MFESEVNQDTSLWLSIFTSNEILIIVFHISQEDLTEIMIIRVIVNSEGL